MNTEPEVKPKSTHGGWRGGRKPRLEYPTKMYRADIRLEQLIHALKKKLKKKEINEGTIQTLIELL